MFGLSFTKLVFTILVIVAVWRGFKLIQQLRERREAAARAPRARAGGRPSGRPLELDPCPLCGTYVPKHGPRCRSIGECLFAEPGGPPARRA